MENPTVPVRVLLVDDDERFTAVVGDLLAEDGFEITGAVHAAAQVADAVHDQAPDVVVLDLVLGDGDGLEVADQLRAAGDATPIVLFSSLFNRRVAAAALEDGYGYVEKTGGVEALELAIESVIDLRGHVPEI